jgi:exonuclease SbcC
VKEITKVILHNFKSHLHSEIPFEHFTAIIGPTNSGKSTIIKGIVLCLYNEPSGDRYITHQEKLCYVETQFSDGTAIRRTRGHDENDNEVNMYELIEADGKVTSLTNFGTGPVEPVVAFHGIPKVKLFGDEICLNISGQLAGPFFLGETSSKKAKMIGKMAKTDIADAALQQINLEVRRKNAKQKELKAELKEKGTKLKELSYLPHAEIAVDNLKIRLQQSQDINEKLKRISFIQQELGDLEKRKEVTFAIIQKEAEVNHLIDQLDHLLTLHAKMTRITSLQSNLLKIVAEKESAQKIIDSVDINQLELTMVSLDSLINMVREVTEAQKIFQKLKLEIDEKTTKETLLNNVQGVDELIKRLEMCRSTLTTINQASAMQYRINQEKERLIKGDGVILLLENRYNAKLKEYRDTLIQNKRCPVCQSEMTEEKVAGIKDLI